jgi:hypothetical protein
MSEFYVLINKVKMQLICFQVIFSVLPINNDAQFKEIKDAIISANEFVDQSDESQIKKLKEFSSVFQKKLNLFKKDGLLKTSEKKLATDFSTYYQNNPHCYTYGIEYGWLRNYLTCSKLGYPHDLPYQTRIGIGHHAGTLNIDEYFLLRDAFFLLLKAHESYDDMMKFSKKWEDQKLKGDLSEIKNTIGMANQNVAIFSRLSILSYFSFLESFVNSIGYDYSQINKLKLDPAEVKILHGEKKGHYISLEDKIEKIPIIIRKDKKPIIITSDPKQIKEPFKSLFGQIKELRDSSVHNSPLKESIWKRPEDWLKEADDASKNCLSAASLFWKACYPNSNGPSYLHNLEYEKCCNLAKETLNWKKNLEHLENKST